MRSIDQFVKERFELIDRIVERQPEKASYYEIVPKKFTVRKVSEIGERYLGFRPDEERYFEGRPVTERFSIPGRVFFFPDPVIVDSTLRYVEIKGYGMAGKEIDLYLHG